MPLEGTQLNTAFSSGAALDTLKHSDFSPMRKDHLHFPENMPATSKKLEMVALRKHALPNENLEKVFGGCAPRPRLVLVRYAHSSVGCVCLCPRGVSVHSRWHEHNAGNPLPLHRPRALPWASCHQRRPLRFRRDPIV